MACVKRGRGFQTCISNFRVALLLLVLCSLAFAQSAPASRLINLNTADAAQLETLPGIGPGLAARILEYRRKQGPFKRPQDLIIVRGFSARRYRQLAHLLTV